MAPDLERPSTVPPPPPPPPPPASGSYNGLPPVDWYPEPAAQGGMPYPSAPSAPAYFGSGQCQQCGGLPAREVTFGRVTGLILWFRTYRTDIVACRSCGLSFGRAEQSKTMMTGWWGFFAFFCNLWWIVRNAISLLRLGRIPEPTMRSRPGLHPGRPAFLRGGMVFAVVLFGAWIYIANTTDEPTWSEGSCVRLVGGTTDVEPVDCGDPHIGRIVAVVSTDIACPATTDGVVEVPGEDDLYCVDEQV